MLDKDVFKTCEEDALKILVLPGCQRNDLGRTFLKTIVVRMKGIVNRKKKKSSMLSPEVDVKGDSFSKLSEEKNTLTELI